MLQSMTSSVLLDLATLRHNLTEFKVRWLAHIEEWKAENRPTTSSMLVRIGRTHVAGTAYCRDHELPYRVQRCPRVVRD